MFAYSVMVTLSVILLLAIWVREWTNHRHTKFDRNYWQNKYNSIRLQDLENKFYDN